MALSDATIATYQMIHMAQSPHEPAAAGSTPETVGAKGGEIGTCAIGPDGNPQSVAFRQPPATRRFMRALLGRVSEIVNGVTEQRRPSPDP
jgi:hypothetical protein